MAKFILTVFKIQFVLPRKHTESISQRSDDDGVQGNIQFFLRTKLTQQLKYAYEIHLYNVEASGYIQFPMLCKGLEAFKQYKLYVTMVIY
jgi:hypothetical protein